MKKFVSLTFVFLPLIATVGCSSSDEASTDETVVGTTMTTQATDTTAPTDAASAPVDNMVIDVRTPGEFAEGHLDGAVNLDLEGGVFEQQFSKLSKDGTYSIYCRSGRRSAE